MNRIPCPHCGTRAKHGCLAPESVGLVRRIVKTDETAVAWGLPASDHWNTGSES